MIQTLVRGAALAFAITLVAPIAKAQEYAALVMDARNGSVVHAVNADKRLHPASLTKMMTLYVVFDAVRQGRLSLDQKVTISSNAAAEPPSKLGLKTGQRIELRYLVRAAAVRSANDAATALAEAVSGSEAAFADRMTQYARAMGLKDTQFKNAHGLTASGHYSTARDMAELGRRLLHDYPQYYNIFARRSTSAGIATVQNTNRRLLDAYPGADGIKTGYTRAAGFNLVSSAERGNKRVIVSVFGGKSSASRNAEVARLMDLGFQKMPNRVRVAKPAPLRSAPATAVAAAPSAPQASTAGIAAAPASTNAGRSVALLTSNRPMPRWMGQRAAIARGNQSIAAAIAEVNAELAQSRTSGAAAVPAPEPRPDARTTPVAQGSASPGSASTFAAEALTPVARNEGRPPVEAGSTGDTNWGVQLGAFRSKGDAERHLLTMALRDLPHLSGGLRRIETAQVQGVTLFRAQFVGLSQGAAEGACATLARERADCLTLTPGI
jgi:D-alanyl-D-alanine carboxypeptidase